MDAATTVTVHGTNFAPSGPSALLCRLSGISGTQPAEAPATYLTPLSVVCDAPPVHSPGALALSVTVDGLAWSATAPFYVYPTTPPAIGALSPRFAEIGATTLVDVSGGFFAPPPRAPLCRFGDFSANYTPIAEWISPRHVRCAAPASDTAGAVKVYLSADGGATWCAFIKHAL